MILLALEKLPEIGDIIGGKLVLANTPKINNSLQLGPLEFFREPTEEDPEDFKTIPSLPIHGLKGKYPLTLVIPVRYRWLLLELFKPGDTITYYIPEKSAGESIRTIEKFEYNHNQIYDYYHSTKGRNLKEKRIELKYFDEDEKLIPENFLFSDKSDKIHIRGY